MMNFIIPEFRSQSLLQLEQLTPEQIVPFVIDKIKENYTIVFRPEAKAIEAVQSLMSKIRAIDPHQYMYPVEQLHMTLIGNIPISIPVDTIKRAVKKYVIKDSVKFILFGLGSNGYCSSVSAYPNGFDVTQTRNSIRAAIGNRGDDFTSFIPAYEKVCWINYMRYKQTPKKELLDFLLSQKDTNFGEIGVGAIQLYKTTSKTLNPLKCEIL